MKGRIWAVILVLALGARGAGILPQGREMEELSLIASLAADGGAGEVRVTAVTGVRASEGEEPQVLTGTGEDLARACADVRQGQATHAYLGQAGQLLLGEDLARESLGEVLDFVLSEREMRLDTLFYIVKGNAGEGLAASASGTAGETPGEDKRGKSVGEILSRLAEGEYTLTPALAPGEDGTLAPDGWAVLGPAGLAGYLTGEAALGAELLSGHARGETAALPGASVELTSVQIRAVRDGVKCCLTSKELQGDCPPEELETWAAKAVRAALAAGLDCWSLGRLRAVTPGAGELGPVEDWNVTAEGRVERYGRRS